MDNQQFAKAKIIFGDDFEGPGEEYLRMQLTFSEQEAQNQINNLNEITGGELDIPWSIVIGISVQPENKAQLIESLQKMTTDSGVGGDIQKHVYNKLVKQGWFVPKIADRGDKVFISFKPEKDFDAQVVSQFNKLYEEGLGDLVKNFQSTMNVRLNSNNSFENAMKQLDDKDRVMTVVTNSVKFEADINGNPEIFEKGIKVLNEMGQHHESIKSELEIAAQMGTISLAFSNLDVEMKFDSSKSLKPIIRQQLFCGDDFEKIWAGELPCKALEKDELLRNFLKTIDTHVEIYQTIPNFSSIKIEGYAPKLSQVLEKVLY